MNIGRNATLTVVSKTRRRGEGCSIFPSSEATVVAQVCGRVYEKSDMPAEMKDYGKEAESMLGAVNVEYNENIKECQYVEIVPLTPGNHTCPGGNKNFEIVSARTHVSLTGCPTHMSLMLREVCGNDEDEWKELLPDAC